jgi:hypothetical protein
MAFSCEIIRVSALARKASQEVRMSYKTTFRAYDILRRAFVKELANADDILKGDREIDEAYFGAKRKGSVEEVQEARPLSTGS